MKQVKIRSKKEYTAFIDNELIKNSIDMLSEFCSSKRIVIITEKNVATLYLNYLVMSLESYGFTAIIYVFSGLEEDKTMKTAGDIIDFFAQNRVMASDIIVAFGGGIVSDIAGFCASIYLRGVNYAIIPTTLLSMIDACIGGKNGVNNNYAKNQIGTYYHPNVVLCDTMFLKSLTQAALQDGFAEMIKYSVIDDCDLFTMLSEKIDDCDYETLITRCITVKIHYISLDEFDKGKRLILNFGHTIGHAIEQYSNYSVSHGRSVAIGMAMITRASEYHGLTKKGTYATLSSMLHSFNLEVKYDIPLEYLLDSVMFDKKIKDNILNLIVLRDITHPYIYKIDCSDPLNLESFFKVLY